MQRRKQYGIKYPASSGKDGSWAEKLFCSGMPGEYEEEKKSLCTKRSRKKRKMKRIWKRTCSFGS
jgi:hypothetical protein